MNETGLIEQVSRIINANYSNIYAIDIHLDKVYCFAFTVTNSLMIKEVITYTDFVELSKKFIHQGEINAYFDALSLNKLESEAQKGNNETKVKYRKLCESGEYRWFVNIINYLPFEGKKLIFMMSEDINERLVDSEMTASKLESQIHDYKTRIRNENESISDAIVQISSVLEQNSGNAIPKETRAYINSVFNRVSIDHPELNQAIITKIAGNANYCKPSLLIVDDSSIIRNSLKRIFEENFNIVMAKNGDEAIQIIRENIQDSFNARERIVGVLLDLMMPVSDGFVVLDYFKANNLFSRLPVAIISGDETKQTRKRVYEYDIVDMLEKPFNTENIKRRITKIIGLYLSSNDLQDVVSKQTEELKHVDNTQVDSLKGLLSKVVLNVVHSSESVKLQKMAHIVASEVASLNPNYNINNAFIEALVKMIPYYNIGAIAMPNDAIVMSTTIKEEIENALLILETFVSDAYELAIGKNIVSYSFELFNGTGYPNNVKGNAIPIEAQITNLLVRMLNHTKEKNFNTVLKGIIDVDSSKYNPDLLNAIKARKKELKEIL